MKDKVKLLFVNPHQFGHTAGYYYYSKYLRSEFDVTYLGFDEGLKKLSLSGISVIYIHQRKNKFLRVFSFLYEAIRETYKSEYNILYVFSFYFSFIIGMFSRGTKKIIDIRTYSVATNPRKRYLLNKIINFNTVFFSRAIILTNDMRDLLKISSSKIHYLPLGAEKYFDGIHLFDELRLLYVGALNTRNVSQSIEGLSMFLKQNNFKVNISYKIVGFGNKGEEDRIRESIDKNGLKEFVTFEGRRNYDEIPYYFRNCNIGISWIPKTPVFDLQPATKTIEYIMSGLFCMATSTKGNRDLITSANGILFEDTPADFALALDYVYKNRHKFNSMRIRETMEEFTWENLVSKNLLPFLKTLAEKN